MNAHIAIGGVAYSLRPSKQWIQERILLILDRTPCHGYELLQALPEDVRSTQLTTLYRWLHSMEREGLVESDTRPGPHGPKRRIYRLGPRGENRLRRVLRDAIEVILHFYDSYRHSVTSRVYDSFDVQEFERFDGKVLFASFPRMTHHDFSLLRFIIRKNENASIFIIGESDILRRTGIKYRQLEGRIEDIPSRNETFSEIWLNGVPKRRILPRAIAECKRVLVDGGVLRISAPFVFFSAPETPTLGAFIRVTATHLFPDLGVVDGNEVGSVIESMFTDCGAFETFPGLVDFWARKTES